MEQHSFEDTIAAVSTPPGQSGIGIVRLSGPRALEIADGVFVPATPTKTAYSLRTFSTAYGRVVDGEETVDEVILTVMRAPRTYTTQDVVEINCHGGVVPVRRTLELVLSRGARLADPGEFTKRAFVFGRIDLAQAEAVLDVINARTTEAQRAAAAQLEGRLSEQVTALRDALVEIMVNLEAGIDFAEDGLELLPLPQAGERCDEIARRLGALIDGAQVGRILRDGVRTAIVGRPNVGKSSLMNALLGHERVIVTPIPGTTRDLVEDSVNIDGLPVVLVDTAGLRDTEDVVEVAGVERTRTAMEGSELVLLMLDGSEALGADDRELLRDAPSGHTVVVVNKRDLPAAWESVQRAWGDGEEGPVKDLPVVEISAHTGQGLDDLRTAISEMIWAGRTHAVEGALVTNVRHKLALEAAQRAVLAARKAVEDGLTEEYVAADLREALDALGEIVGLTLSEDIIDRIFASFCIGK
ncbi:tRNA uridine-5-carboxymethylaminomethyl(34) synthesis GTPase MnmE [bacterium]|nr:tRNA uridine-5-carboxymethylaminomethyl(34) synthesis GTPase MnmE [bacterium]